MPFIFQPRGESAPMAREWGPCRVEQWAEGMVIYVFYAVPSQEVNVIPTDPLELPSLAFFFI